MIQANQITKSYGGKTIFDGISFSIGKGEITGLVGRNGCGKSTLMKIISGKERPDGGSIDMPKGYTLGYLDQHIHFTKPTLIDECCQVLPPDEQYDHYKAEKILFGLGFVDEDMERPPGDFSGGFQLRINLTKTLLQNPNMLLLDEPTNYLDILSLRWLKRFLRSFSGEVIIITHDRDFMDSVTSHTMGIHRGGLKKVKGQTEKYYTQLIVDEEVHEKTRINQEKKIKELQRFVDRFGAKASKATQAQSKARQIEKMKVLGEMRAEEKLGFSFNYKETTAKILLEAADLSFSYSGEASDNLFEGLSLQVAPGDRVAIIGKNGKGKTTLLNVLSGKSKRSTGEIKCHPSTAIGYYEQTNRKELNPENTIAKEIEEANPALPISRSRGICGAMMFSGEAADKKISVLSGGEQSRVLLGKVIAHPANLLLLDEPSNHLDMDSIEAMTEEIESFKGGVILVTHNEEILRRVANKLVIFHKGGAELFLGTYSEFLDKIGWEEEGLTTKKDKGPSGSEPQKRINHSKRDRKRAKALQRDYKKVEKEVLSQETKLKELNGEAVKAAEKGVHTPKTQELYQSIVILQEEIDESYSKMERILEEVDELDVGI